MPRFALLLCICTLAACGCGDSRPVSKGIACTGSAKPALPSRALMMLF